MSRTVDLIMVASGASRRFGAQNKLLVPMRGKPLLYWTLQAFKDVAIHQCVITISRYIEQEIGRILDDIRLPFPVKTVFGGATRQLSVEKGVSALDDPDRVMIHDAARPFVSPALIDRLLSIEESSVIPVLPMTDTIKEVRDHHVVKTLDRECVFRVQTPQVFRGADLKKAYQWPHREDCTDEAGLLEAMGLPIKTVRGCEKNIKVTVKTDWPIKDGFG